ncbi:helix-turn-helix domain-containing protein [Mesobacillus subterraneus]|uniref:helix-turn-helix domain-containing protein n=1 Tax=Mesobacillus subterraneus TaxID=285983 RepID=UPI00203CA589|nr:helix-turn-helix domain-containing protein [Mesobacillus subterraneus]MCM3664843.1 helix-turn-helix domain-containing protein [Mesobacillus subterraneus]MCM3681932.1 helix-turn-helix domain-containing protein [Mesobacillus subterraneus]
MQFGPLIKFYRIQQGLTQKELANGICSVPHLSKIEGNSKEANEETMGLLLERLGVNLSSITENEEQIKQLVSELNEKIDYFLNEEADEAMLKLEEYEGIIPFTTNLHTYELTKFRYLIFKGMLPEAQVQYELLNKQKKIFSQPQASLFSYLYAVWLLKKGNFKKADEILESIGKGSKIEISSGELLYHRALAKSSLEEPGYAIYYGKLALEEFMQDHNFKRILHVMILLGINYTHSKIYEEAQDCFKHLIRNAEILKESKLLPEIYHNMGYLQKKLNKSNEAIVFFEKSLSLQTKNTPHYLITLYSIGEIHSELNNSIKAREAFQEVYLLAKELENRKYRMLANYYLMNLEAPEKSLAYSESKVIPYLEESDGKSEELIWFYKMLSNHYRQIGRFDQAVKYIEKIN